ncbi:MAG: hypothetical protein GQ561_07890 [Calditrichae bacterium]|nr:hypothetical protein [Calditrichia bacterium]
MVYDSWRMIILSLRDDEYWAGTLLQAMPVRLAQPDWNDLAKFRLSLAGQFISCYMIDL